MRYKVFATIASTLIMAASCWASSETVLYNFNSLTSATDGIYPYSGMIADAKGNLYGTTYQGGTNNYGVVYVLKHSGKSWTETVLHSFVAGTADGAYPYGNLVFDTAGNLFGTTYQGGTSNVGTIFELVHSGNSWTFKLLHSFLGYPKDGSYPVAGLSSDSAGNLYGTTYYGGAHNLGTVFQMKQKNGKWTVKNIHGFAGGNGGANPAGGLIAGKNGYYYGSTVFGGATFNVGTVYTLFQARGVWVSKTIYHFTGGAAGSQPWSGLAMDAAGNLYGTTYYGGNTNVGTVYKLTGKAQKFSQKVIYNFKGGAADGQYPYYSHPVVDAKGNVYGTTYQGASASNAGSVFELVLNSGKYKEKILHAFGGTGDGYYPRADLLILGGKLYGTAYAGGTHGGGIAFGITP